MAAADVSLLPWDGQLLSHFLFIFWSLLAPTCCINASSKHTTFVFVIENVNNAGGLRFFALLFSAADVSWGTVNTVDTLKVAVH